jgi:hypothetical protein
MAEEMRRQTEDVVRYYAELDRRVANTGIDGITGLLTVSQHVETALAVVAPQELEWTVRELRSLLAQLVRMDSQLQELRTHKIVLSDGDDGDDAPVRRPPQA